MALAPCNFFGVKNTFGISLIYLSNQWPSWQSASTWPSSAENASDFYFFLCPAWHPWTLLLKDCIVEQKVAMTVFLTLYLIVRRLNTSLQLSFLLIKYVFRAYSRIKSHPDSSVKQTIEIDTFF